MSSWSCWTCFSPPLVSKGKTACVVTLVLVWMQWSCGQREVAPPPAGTDSSGQIKHEDLHNRYHDDSDRNHVEASLQQIMSDMTRHLESLHKSNQIDKDFSAIMGVLLQAELEAAYLALAKSNDSTIRSIALSITRAERASLEQLDTYKSTHTDDSSTARSFYREVSGYLNAAPNFSSSGAATFDKRFSACLTYHHNMAIDLIKIYVTHEGDTVLQKKAAAIAEQYTQQVRLLH